MDIRIPIYQPTLSGREREYVLDCIDSNWISSRGKFVEAFEKAFADYTSCRYSTAVCNGTVALHLALMALGIRAGDEVIVPTLTYVASVNAITYTGAVPVFADSDPRSWQMDPADVAKRISPRTKAILAVHVYGQPCDVRALRALADANRLFLIEDCAEAIGSWAGGRHVGCFADISTYSFYGNKTITTGEGGMVVTSDKTLHSRALHLRGQGLASYRQYWHDIVGYNYRMTNICAAIGLAQLEQVDEFLRRKREIAERYARGLLESGVEVHTEVPGTIHSYWMCSILVADPGHREPLCAVLSEAGVETRPVFYPVHTMPMYQTRYERHPVAENISWRGITLPSWPGLEDAQVDEIVDLIQGFVVSRGEG